MAPTVTSGVLTVHQFSQLIGMSKSWLYEHWRCGDISDLPKPFKLGNKTFVLNEHADQFLKSRAGNSVEVQ